MEFTVNRLELLEIAKSVVKIADDTSPIEALRGVFVESDADIGEISMIATNYEASIFMKTKASVMRDGKMVINAKLLIGMLSLLSGEDVSFCDGGNGIVKVSSGACLYCVRCLPGDNYPMPMMLFPEEMVKLSGICSLAKKTVFAVAKGENSTGLPVLQCVCLKINQNNAHAAACDGARMMLVKGSAESAGATEFLLPAKSFQILASIADDEETYDVGTIGDETVFVKNDMIFTITRQDGTFVDTNQIIQSIKPKYSAVTNAGLMRQALELVSIGVDAAPVNILFADDAVQLKCDGETSLSSGQAQAKLTGKMPESGFFYNLSYLIKLFRVLDGTVKLEIDERGMMLVRAKNEVYFQLPCVHKSSKKAAA